MFGDDLTNQSVLIIYLKKGSENFELIDLKNMIVSSNG